MNKQAFENLIKSYENAECIYKEGQILCHAKISGIQSDDHRMGATVTVIPTPGFFTLNLSSWNILSSWDSFSFDAEYFSSANVGLIWVVFFNPILIEEVTALAKSSLLETDDRTRLMVLKNHLGKYQMQRLRSLK